MNKVVRICRVCYSHEGVKASVVHTKCVALCKCPCFVAYQTKQKYLQFFSIANVHIEGFFLTELDFCCECAILNLAVDPSSLGEGINSSMTICITHFANPKMG